MKKYNDVASKLRSDPNSIIAWMDGGFLPPGGYDTEEITGLQLSLMLDGYDDVFIVLILPGDEYGMYDVWMRCMSSSDMIYMLSKKARDPVDVVLTALENLPDYFPELSRII